jgi:hypothetical protein
MIVCDKHLTCKNLLHPANLGLPRLDDLFGEAGGVYVLSIRDFGVGNSDCPLVKTDH